MWLKRGFKVRGGVDWGIGWLTEFDCGVRGIHVWRGSTTEKNWRWSPKTEEEMFLTHSSTLLSFCLVLLMFWKFWNGALPVFIHSISLPITRTFALGSPCFAINCDDQFPLSLVLSPCEFRGFVDEDNSRLCAPQFEMEPAKNQASLVGGGGSVFFFVWFLF